MWRGALELLIAAEALALRLRARRLAEGLVWIGAATILLVFLLVFLHLALWLGLTEVCAPWQAALAVSALDLLLILGALALSSRRWRRRSRELAEAQALGRNLRRELLALLAPLQMLLALLTKEGEGRGKSGGRESVRKD